MAEFERAQQALEPLRLLAGVKSADRQIEPGFEVEHIPRKGRRQVSCHQQMLVRRGVYLLLHGAIFDPPGQSKNRDSGDNCESEKKHMVHAQLAKQSGSTPAQQVEQVGLKRRRDGGICNFHRGHHGLRSSCERDRPHLQRNWRAGPSWLSTYGSIQRWSLLYMSCTTCWAPMLL